MAGASTIERAKIARGVCGFWRARYAYLGDAQVSAREVAAKYSGPIYVMADVRGDVITAYYLLTDRQKRRYFSPHSKMTALLECHFPDGRTEGFSYEVQGFYFGQWECVTSEVTRFEAAKRLKEYRENEPGTAFRLSLERDGE